MRPPDKTEQGPQSELRTRHGEAWGKGSQGWYTRRPDHLSLRRAGEARSCSQDRNPRTAEAWELRAETANSHCPPALSSARRGPLRFSERGSPAPLPDQVPTAGGRASPEGPPALAALAALPLRPSCSRAAPGGPATPRPVRAAKLGSPVPRRAQQEASGHRPAPSAASTARSGTDGGGGLVTAEPQQLGGNKHRVSNEIKANLFPTSSVSSVASLAPRGRGKALKQGPGARWLPGGLRSGPHGSPAHRPSVPDGRGGSCAEAPPTAPPSQMEGGGSCAEAPPTAPPSQMEGGGSCAEAPPTTRLSQMERGRVQRHGPRQSI